jgi:hypothetical protein
LRQAIGYLPQVNIRDIDLPDSSESDSEEDPESRPLFNLLEDVQNQVSDASEKNRAELDALGTALSAISRLVVGIMEEMVMLYSAPKATPCMARETLSTSEAPSTIIRTSIGLLLSIYFNLIPVVTFLFCQLYLLIRLVLPKPQEAHTFWRT